MSVHAQTISESIIAEQLAYAALDTVDPSHDEALYAAIATWIRAQARVIRLVLDDVANSTLDVRSREYWSAYFAPVLARIEAHVNDRALVEDTTIDLCIHYRDSVRLSEKLEQ